MPTRFSSRTARFTGAACAFAVVVSGFTACASGEDSAPVTNSPTMAPEQSVSEACQASRAEVDRITDDVAGRIDQAAKLVAEGKAPDFTGVFDSVGGAMDRLTESVTNPEVLESLERIQTEVGQLGELKTPSTLLDTPSYLTELTKQLGKIQTAGRALQQQCEAAK